MKLIFIYIYLINGDFLINRKEAKGAKIPVKKFYKLFRPFTVGEASSLDFRAFQDRFRDHKEIRKTDKAARICRRDVLIPING